MRSVWAAVSAVAVAMLLAGCLVEKETPGGQDDGDGLDDGTTSSAPGGPGGPGFAVQQGTAHGSNQGIEVDVRWRACEAGFCANATATNNGDATVQVSSICESPWTDRMRRDGQDVAHREPMVTCAAYGREAFGPGDVAHANLTWDQRVWVDDHYEDAPEGAYTWSIVYWWDDAQGGQRQEAVAAIQLIVGET